MKRIVILILAICLTGCVGNEDFSKTCTNSMKTTHLEDNTSIYVVYNNDDKVKEATVTKSYKAIDKDGEDIIKDIKSSIEEYNYKYGDSGIKFYLSKDSNDEYEIKYYLPVPSLDDEILADFKLKKNSAKLFRSLKKENMECGG